MSVSRENGGRWPGSRAWGGSRTPSGPRGDSPLGLEAASPASPPPRRAGARAVFPAGPCRREAPRTDGRSRRRRLRPPQPRSEPPLPDRWPAVLALAAGGLGGRRAAVRGLGPGRTAGRLPPPLPRRRPPPAPIGHRAAPLLRHRPAGGALRGPAESWEKPCGRTGAGPRWERAGRGSRKPEWLAEKGSRLRRLATRAGRAPGLRCPLSESVLALRRLARRA